MVKNATKSALAGGCLIHKHRTFTQETAVHALCETKSHASRPLYLHQIVLPQRYKPPAEIHLMLFIQIHALFPEK